MDMTPTTANLTAKAADARIRRAARRQGLYARKCRNARARGLWFFADDRNCLRSPEQGLDDDEALKFLES
jgi:hypothetical protein